MKIGAILLLVLLIVAVYHPFFIFSKIPIPADAMVGGFYPWLDYKWGWEVGVPIKNSTLSDVYSAFYVWKNLSIEALKNLQWPLWNQYSFSGAPLLGSFQTSHFFPFNILLLFPGNLGWALFIFGQTLAAALGMYLLLGIYTKNILAKIAGAIVFSLSGFMSTWVEFGNGVWAAACLPWIFYSLEKFWQLKKVRYLYLLTFFLVSLYLAGLAQMIIFASVLFFYYLLFKYLTLQINFGQIILPAIYWVLSLGIATIEIIPAYDLATLSIRSSEAYARSFNFGLTPITEMIRIWVADFFGNPATYNEWSKLTYFEHSMFLGTLSVPLIFTLFNKKFLNKTVLVWVIVFIGSIFLAVDSLFTRTIYSVPFPLLTYSSSGRIFFITSFSAGILIAIALANFQENIEFRKNFLAIVSGFFLLNLFIAIIIFLNSANIEDSKNLMVSFRNMVVPLGILFSAVVLSAIYINFERYKFIGLIPLLLVAFLYFDLTRYFLKFNPFVSQNLVFPKTPVIEFLQKDPTLFRIVRTDERLLPTNTWINYKISSIEGYDPMALENYNRFFNIVNDNSYKSRVSRFAVAKKYRDNFLDALNVKYLLVLNGSQIEEQLKTKYKRVFEDKSSVIYENEDYLNRAYFISKLTAVSDLEEMIKKIDDKSFNPRQEAVIVGGKSGNFATEGNITFDYYTQDRVGITTVAQGDRFLVLTDTYEQSWKLIINNTPGKIYEVNGALRGVLIPAGVNKLEFRYSPKAFTWALYISVISLLVIVVVTLYYGMRSKLLK